MPSPLDDEVLLNRYVDSELEQDEQTALEQRLRVDAGLRSQLADLVSLNAGIDIGLAGVRVGQESATKGDPAAIPSSSDGEGREAAITTWMRGSHWVGSHRVGATAAAVLCLVAIGAGTWIGLRFWPSSRLSASPASAPYAVLAQLEGKVDKAAVGADLGEILNPATGLQRRQEIYRSWKDLAADAVEPLVWAVAPFERDPGARRSLFIALPRGAVRNYPALLGAARAEWSAKALDPLSQLITQLRFHRVAETEQFFVELLLARPELPSQWFAGRLQTIQEAFPTNPTISARVASVLTDPDEFVRAHAALARAAVGQHDGIECARTLLESSSADVRLLAVTTINRHGTDVDVPQLAPLVNDPDPSVRNAVRDAFKGHRLPVPQSSFNP